MLDDVCINDVLSDAAACLVSSTLLSTIAMAAAQLKIGFNGLYVALGRQDGEDCPPGLQAA